MQPLDSVHVSTQRGWHGGEEQARLLVRGLAARGHRCLIFARDDGAFALRMRGDGFEVLPVAGSGRSPRAIWKTWLRLRELRPDVIHFHDPHALSGAGMAAWLSPISARVVARRVDFSIRSAWRYRKLADRVIAVSQAVADVCQTSGLQASQVRVVHDGVEPGRARSGDRQRGRAALGLSAGVPLLLCVATLTDHKGHSFLLQAMPAVLAQFPGARLLLAGDGELRPVLEQQSQALGISQAVDFLGYRSDIPDLLQAADLFVMPSHLEGLCSTLIDVMFARTPIVATTAGGIPEILGSHAIDGPPVARLTPPRNPAALAAAIVESLKNPQALRPQVDRADQRAQRYFTAECMVEKTLAVYAELLSASKRPMARPTARQAA